MRKITVLLLTLALMFGLIGTAHADREHRARHKSRVHRVVKKTNTVPFARVATVLGKTEAEVAQQHCNGKKTIAKAKNYHGDYIFSWWRSAYWCGRHLTEFTQEQINRGEWTNNAWWNLWSYDKLVGRVHTNRINDGGVRYHYDRIVGRFKACWQWCFMDFEVWVAQTIRANGTFDDGYGPKGVQL